MEAAFEVLNNERRNIALAKAVGNELFGQGKYRESIQAYTAQIKRMNDVLIGPEKHMTSFRMLKDDLAVFYSNRALAYTRLENYAAAIDDMRISLDVLIETEKTIPMADTCPWDPKFSSSNANLYLKLRLRLQEACCKIGNYYMANYHFMRAMNTAPDSASVAERTWDVLPLASRASSYRSQCPFGFRVENSRLVFEDGQESLSILFVPGVWAKLPGAAPSAFKKNTVESAVCCYQRKIYAFGGKDANIHKPRDTFSVYDLETNKWTLVTPSTTSGGGGGGVCPSARSGARGVVYEGCWYVYGGNGGGKKKPFWKFDFATQRWSQIPTPKDPKCPGDLYEHSAVLYQGNKMIISGGTRSKGETMDIWEYDLVRGTWRQLYKTPRSLSLTVECGAETSPWPRSLHASWIVDDDLYIFGGYTGYPEVGVPEYDRHMDNMWQFSLRTHTMKRCILLGDAPCRRAEMSAVVWEVPTTTTATTATTTTTHRGTKKVAYMHGGYGSVFHATAPNLMSPNGQLCTSTYFGDTFEFEVMTKEMLEEEAAKVTGRNLIEEVTVRPGDVVVRSRRVLVDDQECDTVPPQPARAGFGLTWDSSEERPHLYVLGGYSGYPAVFMYPEILKLNILTPEEGNEKEAAAAQEEGEGGLGAAQKKKKQRICAWCKTPRPSKELLICGGCKGPRYCNRECQKQHWKTHKTECKTSKN